MLLDNCPNEPEVPETIEVVRAITSLVIKGLMDRPPGPNSTWCLEERTQWLRTAASVGRILQAKQLLPLTCALVMCGGRPLVKDFSGDLRLGWVQVMCPACLRGIHDRRP